MTMVFAMTDTTINIVQCQPLFYCNLQNLRYDELMPTTLSSFWYLNSQASTAETALYYLDHDLALDLAIQLMAIQPEVWY